MSNYREEFKCDRADDMIAYLYGESSEIEAKSFERHAAECAACRQELPAFQTERASFATIRERAAASFEPLSLDFLERPKTAKDRRRSAFELWREFFGGAPVWARAGAVAAGVLFAALVALAVFNSEIRIGDSRIALRPAASSERVVYRNAHQPDTYTREQVDQLIAERERTWLAEYDRRAAAAAAAQNDLPQYRVDKRNDDRDSRATPAPRTVRASANPRQTTAPRRQPRPTAVDDEASDLSLSDLLSQVK